MSNVTLTWTLPPVTPRQRAHAGTEISFRVSDSVDWTVQDIIAATEVQELVFVDQAAGTMFYRAILMDDAGELSPPAETSADVPFDGPDMVVDFSASVE